MAGSPNGGAELFFERLAIGLHEAGDTVLPIIRTNADRAGRLAAAGLAPRQLGFGGPFDVMTRPHLRHILSRFCPDVAVAWMNRAARMAPRGRWILVGRLGGYYNLSYYGHCDHLVGNTRGIVDWIVGQGWPKARVHHLPNFVADLAGAVPLARAALGVPPEKTFVLALGRLHRSKGFDILIRSLPRLPGIHAVIAGEGPERADLLDIARREGVSDRVHLIGWRQDIGSLLASASALVCPSRYEPLGNVIIEAWSSCRPVIACASDGPRELIANGEGVLVSPNDPIALAEGLDSVLGDVEHSAALSRAGRARFELQFAQVPVVARWRDFMRDVERT